MNWLAVLNLVLAGVIVGLALLWWSKGNLRAALVNMAVAGVCAANGVGLLWWWA